MQESTPKVHEKNQPAYRAGTLGMASLDRAQGSGSFLFPVEPRPGWLRRLAVCLRPWFSLLGEILALSPWPVFGDRDVQCGSLTYEPGTYNGMGGTSGVSPSMAPPCGSLGLPYSRVVGLWVVGLPTWGLVSVRLLMASLQWSLSITSARSHGQPRQ